jgi:hypothetical protein
VTNNSPTSKVPLRPTWGISRKGHNQNAGLNWNKAKGCGALSLKQKIGLAWDLAGTSFLDVHWVDQIRLKATGEWGRRRNTIRRQET